LLAARRAVAGDAPANTDAVAIVLLVAAARAGRAGAR
jgi:hypothetical protein